MGSRLTDGSKDTQVAVEVVAIDEEEDAFDLAGLDETFDLLADDIGLAGAGGEFGEEAAFAQFDGAVDGAQAGGLVIAEAEGFAVGLIELGYRNGD